LTLRLRLVPYPSKMHGLVGEHRDRERGVVVGADLVLERDPVERPADGRLEVGKSARDERDAGSVRADAREGIALVADHPDGMAGDPRRLRSEAPLGPGPLGAGNGRPARFAVDPVGVREEKGAYGDDEKE